MNTHRFISLSLFTLVLLCLTSLQIKAQTVEEVRVTGKTLAVINNGDFVHPKISPDGSQIAYSRVVIMGNKELTEIAIRNLKTNRTRVLLTPKASERYATYKAYVSELEWLDNGKLVAFVSDGDVDYSKLTFNVSSGRIVKTEFSGDEDDFDIVPLQLRFAVNAIQTISPKLSKEIINSGLQSGNGAFVIGDRGVVLQFRYSGHDDHIHFFDFLNKRDSILLEVPGRPERAPRLLGGFVLGERIIFGVDYQEAVRFYGHKDRKSKLLSESKLSESDTDMPELIIKHQTADKILFLVPPYSTTSGMRSSLWLYDRNGLKKANDMANLLDVDIKANRIALCYWVDTDKRHILIKELKL